MEKKKTPTQNIFFEFSCLITSNGMQAEHSVGKKLKVSMQQFEQSYVHFALVPKWMKNEKIRVELEKNESFKWDIFG